MVPTRYQIVVQHDGNYGVVLTQLGATVRTATGFANKAEAQAWVARDAKSENADNPFRERGPENPQEADPFRKGDSVVYPAHGVGRIERVGFEDIAGHRLNLIHISFDDNQMTLRVPVARARTAGLRKLASRKELADAMGRLRGRPRVSRLRWAKRAQDYLAKINSGELGTVAEVVRDLQSTGDGSNSSFSQRHLFELAVDRLAAECAAINRTAKVEVVTQLNQALREARASRTEQLSATTGT